MYDPYTNDGGGGFGRSGRNRRIQGMFGMGQGAMDPFGNGSHPSAPTGYTQTDAGMTHMPPVTPGQAVPATQLTNPGSVQGGASLHDQIVGSHSKAEAFYHLFKSPGMMA